MVVSEERLIVERIKDLIKNEKAFYPLMLRNGRILNMDDYRDMVRRGKINPQDAFVYINRGWSPSRTDFYYQFLSEYRALVYAYLSKLGFYFKFFAAPATGLKYVTDVEVYEKYLSVEVVNLDTVVSNTNLLKIVAEVIDDKLISGEEELTDEEYEKILDMFKSQKLFAGRNFHDAQDIIYEYYDRGKKSLAKEVARTVMDYYKIFQSYRVCYDMNSWKEIDCLSINLD